MRGKATPLPCLDAAAGITPARAGKSRYTAYWSPNGRDHPRACGEKINTSTPANPAVGSPPRVRGKGSSWAFARLSAGITPARAGKRSNDFPALWRAGDHPRACGEKARIATATPPQEGSPPRVRGKVVLPLAHALQPGITPARAGKSSKCCRRCYSARDHPRACGEKSEVGIYHSRSKGSPPRVRRKDTRFTRIEFQLGITPARAGKSGLDFGYMLHFWDHPRACGEKATENSVTPSILGSPPRVRGKGLSRRSRLPSPGITPARAGKRSSSSRLFCPLRDHPRACGEKGGSLG